MGVSFITGLLIPAAPFGAKMAEAKLHAKPGTLKFNLLSNIPVCLTMATVLSLVFAALNVGFNKILLIAWLSSIPLAFLASYITSVLLTPLAVKLSNTMTSR